MTRPRVATAASSRTPPPNLAARVKALEDRLPSRSHLMADVGDRCANLRCASTAENWPLADFYLGETRSHLRWAVRRLPIREDSTGQDVNLTNIIEGGGQVTARNRTASADQPAHEVASRHYASGPRP